MEIALFLGIPTFYFTRRCLSRTDENSTTPSHTQGYVNNGFYAGNLIYSNGGDNQETLVIEEKNLPPLKVNENYNASIIGTPSPSRVIESLDLVIDSYVDDSSLPDVMSASEPPPALVLTDKPLDGDFRDTPNSTLRAELLNSLNNDIDPHTFEVSLDEVDDSAANIKLKMDGSLSSEISYVSASSNIFTGPKETSDTEKTVIETFELNASSPVPPPPPPPPPPPMADYNNFSPKNTSHSTGFSNTQNTASKTLDKIKRKNRESPMIISKNSLNSVKLKHVHRPSIERRHSEENKSITSQDSLEKTIPNVEETKSSSPKPYSSPLSKLKHVRRPSLENESLNDSENVKPSRYFKSKSVNDLEKKYTPSSKSEDVDTLKRMEISKHALNSVKLKPVVRPTLNLDQVPKIDLPDSLKFGTTEFKEFKEKLNDKLNKPVKILREPSFLDPKNVSKRSVIQIDRNNVINDHIDFNKARVTMESEVDNKLLKLKSLERQEGSNKNSDENTGENVNKQSSIT